jgi:ribosomal protein L11 methyltransferase
MWIARLRVTEEAKDLLLAELWSHGVEGIEENHDGEGHWLDAWFADRVVLEGMEAEWRLAPEQDWVAVSREGWNSLPIGKRLWLTPPWENAATPAGRLRLEYRHGSACGTGQHPCTRLCLAVLDELVQPADRFAEIGCGSGILSQAVGLLGGEWALGCDLDFDWLRETRSGTGLDCFHGSTRSIRDGAVSMACANINAQECARLAPELQRIASRWVICSGFQHREADAVRRAWQRQSSIERELDGWVLLGWRLH